MRMSFDRFVILLSFITFSHSNSDLFSVGYRSVQLLPPLLLSCIKDSIIHLIWNKSIHDTFAMLTLSAKVTGIFYFFFASSCQCHLNAKVKVLLLYCHWFYFSLSADIISTFFACSWAFFCVVLLLSRQTYVTEIVSREVSCSARMFSVLLLSFVSRNPAGMKPFPSGILLLWQGDRRASF